MDNTTSTIGKAALTVTATQVSKTYDGTTVASGTGTVGTLAGAAAGDVVNAAGSQVFTDKNAGTGNKIVTASGVTIKDSADADMTGNYDIRYVDNTTSTIGKAALTANLVGSVNKIYDSSANATLAAGNFSLSGFVTGEGASVTQTAGTYASPNVDANGGTGAVSASLLSSHLSANTGTLLSNYSVPATASGNVGTITPVALTVKVGDTKAFVTQLANTAIDTGVSYDGLKGNDSPASALMQVPVASDRTYTGATPTPLVGSYSAVYDLGFTPTAQNGNYTVTVQKGNLQVIPADKLLITIASQNDTYGNRSAGNAGQASGVTAQYCLAPGNCNGANIFNLSMSAGSGNSWSGSDNTNTMVTFDTSVNTSGKLSGADFLKAGNYNWGVANLNANNSGQFSGYEVNSGTLAVGRLAITPTANAVSKVYDGTQSAAGVTLNTAQALTGDVVSATAGSGSYITKNVITNDTVTFGNLSLQGADKDNYAIAVSTVQGMGSITPKSISVSGITAADKVYDGGNTASVSSTGASFAGLVSGDSLSVSATGSFADKNVGSGKTVTLTSSYSGADRGNYTITDQASTSATITPKALTLAAVTDSKTYDGSVGSSRAVVVSGLVSTDSVTATQAFDSKNVLGEGGSTLKVNTGYTVNDGNGGNNYTVITTTAPGTVTPLAATVTASGARKVFTGLQQSLDAAQTSGFLSGDQITVSGLATGTAPGLYNSNLAVTGADARNYNIRYQNATLEILPITSSLNLLKTTENPNVRPETRIVYRGFALSGSVGAAVGGSRPTLAGPSSCAPEDSVICQCDFKPELNLEICLPVQDQKN